MIRRGSCDLCPPERGHPGVRELEVGMPIQHSVWSWRLVPWELTHSACTPGCSHKKAIKGSMMGLELFRY